MGFKMRPGGSAGAQTWSPSLVNPFVSIPNVVVPSSCRAELQRQQFEGVGAGFGDQRLSSSSSSSQCVPPFVRHSDVRSSDEKLPAAPSSDLGSLLAWGRGTEQEQQQQQQHSQVEIPEPAAATAAPAASPFIDFLGVGGV